MSSNRLIQFIGSDDQLDGKVLEAGAPMGRHLSGNYDDSFNCARRVSRLMKVSKSEIPVATSQCAIIRDWTVQERNLRFLSKFNPNIVRLFQASSRKF